MSRLTIIGVDPSWPRASLTVDAHRALAAADRVFFDPEASPARAVLVEDAPDARWNDLAESTQGTAETIDGLPAPALDAARSGERAVWLVAGDPTARGWQEALARCQREGVELGVLPAPRALPLRTPRPLDGLRVLVTRARHQAGETCRLLEARGADTICLPTIEIVPLADRAAELETALRRQAARAPGGGYDYLVLTSANAVDCLRRALERQKLDGRALAGVTICAIGPGTARALAGLGLRADMIPDDHRAEGLLELLDEEQVRGRRVLLPRAEVARELLPLELSRRGATVDLIAVYRTVLPSAGRTAAGLAELRAGRIDAVTFTSASTVDNLVALVGRTQVLELVHGRVLVVAIGPVTRDACQGHGIAVDVMPEQSYTLPTMVDALQQHLERRGSGERAGGG